jgi:hypothetical protein
MACDNLATQKTPVIQVGLARRPRFHLHSTLTGSSWINVHKSVQALEADIRAGSSTGMPTRGRRGTLGDDSGPGLSLPLSWPHQ